MQIHVLLVFLTYYLLTTTIVTAEEISQNTKINIKDANSEHKRKLPLFPKNTLKFVVTPKPQIESLINQKPTEKTVARKPIMPQLTLKPTTQTITTKLTSRKPLMKLRTFTIKTLSNGKYSMRDKETDMLKSTNKNDKLISEDHSQELNQPEESRINVEKLPRLNNEQNKQELNSDVSVQSKINDNNYLSEEVEDHNEFIFLDKDELALNDMIDSIEEDFDGDFETTTVFNLDQKTMRVKRSKNIIEEENMASTISGFKYTGADTKINDVYFKNINS